MRQPEPAVVAWVQAQAASELSTTSITLAEIRYGIERLPDGRRKEELRSVADDVLDLRRGRVGFDAQIASICRTRQATLATRNVKDFEGTGVATVNPWTHQT